MLIYPLHIEQILPTAAPEVSAIKPVKGKRGRPKGSKNHAKAEPILSPLLQLLQGMMAAIRDQLEHLQVKHIVVDGKFGNYPSTWTIQNAGYHIISKMRQDAALYLPYSGSKPARGPMPRYAEKLNYKKLPLQALSDSRIEEDYRIDSYQLQLYHKDYPNLLHVVIPVKTHLTTGKCAHVILFSTDLDLSAAQIVDCYSLRFQIEFNFRDAKQYWGLEDFMNVTPTAVNNAVHLSFLMVNFSTALLQPYRQHDPDFSVLDLKAQFRARRYLSETIKMLPDMPEPHLISRIWQRLSRFGAIRTRPIHDFAA